MLFEAFNVAQRTVLIFDNAPAHRQAAETQLPDHAEIRYLPAYRPFLNIAENCFSQWKAAVKRNMSEVRDQLLNQAHPERVATLAQICEQCVDVITPANAVAYFRHLMKEDILM